MSKRVVVALLPFALLALAGTCEPPPGTPQTSDCPVYCSGASDAQPFSVVHDQCVAAFGNGFAVAVRTCPRGLVPAACASLSEYSDVTVQCDPGDVYPDDVLCCWE